jgi:hypothetical protein
MRMTVHLIAADDAGWMLPLFEPGIERWSRRRLGQLGMPAGDQERSLRTVKRSLEKDGPLTRGELAERVVAAGVDLDQQRRGHVMGLAVTSGVACLGPDRGRHTCLVRRQDWLGELPAVEREAALAELARRYLRAFGPASDRDFAYWSGLGLGEVRTGLEAIATELDQTRLGEETLLSLHGALPRLPPKGQLRLLGAFDTYLLGYRSREFAVAADHAAAVKEGGGGWIRPVIFRDGKVIGGWRSALKGNRIEISLSVEGTTSAERKAFEAEVADVGRFMDREVVATMPRR